MIEAAGGVLWRIASSGDVEVLLIHRPRYDDWSFPKGKLQRGEAPLAGAQREVQEETGLRAEPGARLPDTRYVDRKGRAKRVRYWAMRVLEGRFEPNDEVDHVRWVAIGEAANVLTYERDVALLAEFVQSKALVP